MYDNRVDILYLIPVDNLSGIIYTRLKNVGVSNCGMLRDKILYNIVTKILKDDLGCNLVSVKTPDGHYNTLAHSTEVKVWKDMLWAKIRDTVVVDLNILYYVDILVSNDKLYIKLEEDV